MAFRYPPSPIGNSWKDWASQLVSYLRERDVDTETAARALQLEHKIGSAAKAISDGVIMYDPSRDALTISVNGAWLPIGSTYHDPTGIASWNIIGTKLDVWGYVATNASGQYALTYPKTFAVVPSVTCGIPQYTGPLWLGGVDATVTMTTSTVTFITKTLSAAGSWYVHYHASGEWDGVS